MTGTVPEFSRRVRVSELPEGGKQYRFEATPEEREAIARRLDILGVEELTAHFTVVPEGQGAVARGRFEAVAVQECVVTLEPVTSRVSGEIMQRFAPEGRARPAAPEIEIDPLAEEPPEPLIHGEAELGELVIEDLALTLDPWPRHPDAHMELPREDGGGADTPFAKLRDLKLSATEG